MYSNAKISSNRLVNIPYLADVFHAERVLTVFEDFTLNLNIWQSISFSWTITLSRKNKIAFCNAIHRIVPVDFSRSVSLGRKCLPLEKQWRHLDQRTWITLRSFDFYRIHLTNKFCDVILIKILKFIAQIHRTNKEIIPPKRSLHTNKRTYETTSMRLLFSHLRIVSETKWMNDKH